MALILITSVVTIFAAVVVLNFSTGEKKIERRIERLYGVRDPAYARAMGVLLGPAILGGNRIEVLVNGDRIFPGMLAAIRGATTSITFESFIYWSGATGQEFAEALVERARAGVKVHLLVDWIGSSKMEDRLLDMMEQGGVEIRRFHQPHWYNLARLNNRTHRKVLVTDGVVGFTGGVGISDLWRGDAQDANHWRDTHFKVEGPVVAQMQSVFLDNWTKATGAVLHGDDYFPALVPVGPVPAHMFSSSPSGGSESMQLMYMLAITAAAESILVSSAYFVPDVLTVQTLVAALKRGVDVQIITPGASIDTETVRRASRAVWGDLLEAGAKIYEYTPTMYHCKVMIVDELMVSVGSTNFDNRSFRHNDEANLNIYDADFARQQVAIFREDLARSRQITFQEWQQRPWTEKVWENTTALLRSQL